MRAVAGKFTAMSSNALCVQQRIIVGGCKDRSG